MSDDESGDTLETDIAELTETVERLQRELERNSRPLLVPRPPRRSELRQFTSEVAIPGLILLLQTNVRALKLLQRTLRLAEDSDPEPDSVRSRANDVGAAAMRRLDDALSEIQSTLSSDQPDEKAQELLDRAQSLQEDIQSQLDSTDDTPEPGPKVDVEAELQSIKDQVDGDDDANNSK